jgi:hypothetical protein
MASRVAGCRSRDLPAAIRRSRTTSDFDSFRRRDSASIWAIRTSGNRTVSGFIALLYYIADIRDTPTYANRAIASVSPGRGVSQKTKWQTVGLIYLPK